ASRSLMIMSERDARGPEEFESQRPIGAGEVRDIEGRHARHAHQCAVMRAVLMQAMLDVTNLLQPVAGLATVGDDVAGRGAPDMPRLARPGLAVLMHVTTHHE